MISFDEAVEYVLRNEGGLVDDPTDRGGVTKYGISLRFLKSLGLSYDFNQDGIINEKEIIKLTLEQAKSIYKHEFWDDKFEQINEQRIVNYLFDMHINMGREQSVKIVQRALWACGLSRTAIKDDGILGFNTIKAINDTIRTFDALLPAMRSERASVFRIIVCKKPEQQKFLNGWLNRAYEQ